MNRDAEYEFWRSSGEAYAALCLFSNPDDWENILDAIAARILDSVRPGMESLRILDVGAGIGETSFRIGQRLLSKSSVMPEFALVEPSDFARSCAIARLGTNRCLGGTRYYRRLRDIEQEPLFDTVLYIHSTYYIPELSDHLKRAIDLTRRPCRFVILAMPSTSPYFLGLGRLGHMNVAEDIIDALERIGLATQVQELRMRLNIPRNFWSEQDCSKLFSSLYPAHYNEAKLIKRFPSYLPHGIDLKDWLITAIGG